MRRASFEEKLEKKKAQSVLEPLFRAARLTNELALRRLNARQRAGARNAGGDGRLKTDVPLIRASHTTLLPHIDLGGTRLTVLADRLGVSKQAVAPLVEELEEMGMLTKVSDPADGRAKLIVFTQQGRRGLLEGMALLQSVEGEIARVVGRREMDHLGRILQRVLAYLDEQQETERENSL